MGDAVASGLCWTMCALFVCTASAHADVQPFPEVVAFDSDDPFVGQWLGEMNRPQLDSAFMQLVISRDSDGALQGVATVPNMMALNLTVKNLDAHADDRTIEFAIKMPFGMFTFHGTLNEDGQELAGETSRDDAEDGVTDTFSLKRVPHTSDFDHAMAFAGELDTTIEMKFEMAIVLAQTPGGNWVGHMDIPLQHAENYPIINIKQVGDDANVLTAELPGPAVATFEMTLNDDRSVLKGTLTQAGMAMPFEFKRDMNYAYRGVVHPQVPKPPFPYSEREFKAAHPAGHELAGTLTIPSASEFGAGPFPAAILISGSGQQDRDETLVGHKPFLVLADFLTRQGIAVARYDDRGVGDSTGRDSVATCTTRDFATDTEAVLDWLRTQPEVDANRIGLIGHSEGGIIAPLVAAHRGDDVAYLVLLAGSGVPGRDVLLLQIRLLHESMELDPALVDDVVAKLTIVLDKIIAGEPDDDIRSAVEDLLAVPSPMYQLAGDKEAAIQTVFASTKSPWMVEFLKLDPRVALAQVRCPVLALNGTKDLQVDADQNLTEIERVLREERVDVTATRCEGLNHLFQPADTGAVAEYASIETTFDESTMRDIAAWVRSKMGAE